MIVVRLEGGMGNQMFQYAFGKYLSKKWNTELLLDTSYLLNRELRKDFVYRDFDLDVFNVFVNLDGENKLSLFKTNYVSPRSFVRRYFCKYFNYSPRIKQFLRIRQNQLLSNAFWHNIPDNSYLYEGTWSNLEFLNSIKDDLTKEFVIKPDKSFFNGSLLSDIENSNSVCLNVRRADFVELTKTNSLHGVCSLQYFKNALKLLLKKYDDLKVFVFSDDLDWCFKNFADFENTYFVTHDVAGRKFQNYLHYMMHCKHFIIPNSTFAWWAAWLSKNPNKTVIAPDYWLYGRRYKADELIPKDWIRLPAFQ